MGTNPSQPHICVILSEAADAQSKDLQVSAATNTPEKLKYFEGCLPIEETARRGRDTLRFGPMKPAGLTNPKTGRWPYAAVQLRQENLRADCYNLVGFQNHLKYGEQARVLRLIPGLENATFLRYGQIHRNTYINAPAVLTETLQLKAHPGILIAGQLSGVEGYTESIASGLLAGRYAAALAQGHTPTPAPRLTANGSLTHYITHAEEKTKRFDPANITFDLLPPLEEELRRKIRDKKERHRIQCERALEAWNEWLSQSAHMFPLQNPSLTIPHATPMRPLSAAESIQPAINRTKTLLFQPFQLGRSWKLAATAYFTAMGYFFLPTPLLYLGNLSFTPSRLAIFVLSATLGIAFSAFMFWLFYLGARLEFVVFDIVLLQEKFVAPSWKRHAHQTWRWIGLKLLLSLAIAILFGPIFYLGFRSLQQNMLLMTPGQPPSPEFFRTLISFYALVSLPMVLAILSSSLLTNFVLPSIALENTTAREAMRRFGELIRVEPGAVALFAVLKVVLAVAAVIAAEMLSILAVLILCIPLGLVAFLGGLLLRSAGDAGHLVMIAGGILLAIVGGIMMFYALIFALGCIHVFFQAYALYFLGGRYPLLGDMLEPPSPAFPYIAPPASPPPHFEPIIPPPPEPTA